MMSRRKLLQSGFPAMAGLAIGSRYAKAVAHSAAEFTKKCNQLEAASGGRLGVAMRNTATGVRLG